MCAMLPVRLFGAVTPGIGIIPIPYLTFQLIYFCHHWKRKILTAPAILIQTRNKVQGLADIHNILHLRPNKIFYHCITSEVSCFACRTSGQLLSVLSTFSNLSTTFMLSSTSFNVR